MGRDRYEAHRPGRPREVRERIDIFNEEGGFVFNSIHNIQADTPTENMLAMFRAVRESAGGA
jgi:uroporphyrinogen-III decarboxylase